MTLFSEKTICGNCGLQQHAFMKSTFSVFTYTWEVLKGASEEEHLENCFPFFSLARRFYCVGADLLSQKARSTVS